MENRSFCGSGRPRADQKPFKKVAGFAPYLFKGFWAARGRPEPQNDRFSIKSLNHPLRNPREMALELVSGADFLSKLMCGAGPVDLRVSRAPRGRPENRKSTISGRPKNHTLKTQVYSPRPQ